MKSPVGPFLRMATPLRAWSQRFAFLLLIVAAGGMIVLNQADPAFLGQVRTRVTDAVAPVLDVLSRPISALRSIGDEVDEIAALREQNAGYRDEIARLEAWRTEAFRLRAENATFQAMLNYIPEAPGRYMTARVIADSGSVFVRSVLVNVGSDQGIGEGQPVMNEEGLVGRVADLGRRSARILLLTDLNSRIPVILERTRDRGILAGDNTEVPRLRFLPPTTPVAIGDRVVTSGHGGVFPPGLPVGEVIALERGPDRALTRVEVQPFVNWNRLEFVRVIDHDPLGLVTPDPGAQEADSGE